MNDFGFIDWLQRERGLSPHTVQAYRRDLNQLSEQLGHSGVKAWADASATALQGLLNDGHRNGLSVSTLRRRSASLRTLYRYLEQEGHCSHNPAEQLQLPRMPKRLPRGINVDQIMRLMQPLEEDSPRETRNLAMFELMYSSGLRLSELTALDMNDLRHSGVRVMGKGRREREIPIGGCALAAINKWLAVRGTVHDTEALFLNNGDKRIGQRTVQHELSRHARLRGLHHINPHALRHAFATHMLESSGNLRAVQEFLGHRSLSSTQIYTQLDFLHLSKVYDKAHPRSGNKT